MTAYCPAVGDLVGSVESGNNAVVVAVKRGDDLRVWLTLVFNAGTDSEYRTVGGPSDVYLVEPAL